MPRSQIPHSSILLYFYLLPLGGGIARFLYEGRDWYVVVYGLITDCEYLPAPEEVKTKVSNSHPDGESWIVAVYWQNRIIIKYANCNL